jgi:hypothetical protein
MPEPYFQASSSYEASSSARCAPRRHGGGIVRTALLWGAIAVAVMVSFSLAVAVVGFAFHVIGLLFEAALVTAVVAFVWRVVAPRR